MSNHISSGSRPSKDKAKNKTELSKYDADLATDLKGSGDSASLTLNLLAQIVRLLVLIEKNTKK